MYTCEFMSRKRVCVCLHVHVCPYVFLFPLCLSTRTLPRRVRPQGPLPQASDGGEGKASRQPAEASRRQPPRAGIVVAPARATKGCHAHTSLSSISRATKRVMHDEVCPRPRHKFS